MRIAITSLTLFLALTACSLGDSSLLTISDAEYHGFVKRSQPLYRMVGAINGAKGSWSGEKVEIYEFASDAEMNIKAFENLDNWRYTCVKNNLVMISEAEGPCTELANIGPVSAADKQVVEALNRAWFPLVAVYEFYGDRSKFPADNDEAGLPPADEITGNYVSSVGVIPGGRVAVTFSESAAPAIAGKSFHIVVESVDGRLVWSCEGAELDASLLPINCPFTRGRTVEDLVYE